MKKFFQHVWPKVSTVSWDAATLKDLITGGTATMNMLEACKNKEFEFDLSLRALSTAQKKIKSQLDIEDFTRSTNFNLEVVISMCGSDSSGNGMKSSRRGSRIQSVGTGNKGKSAVGGSVNKTRTGLIAVEKGLDQLELHLVGAEVSLSWARDDDSKLISQVVKQVNEGESKAEMVKNYVETLENGREEAHWYIKLFNDITEKKQKEK
ncbi:hypothetical protein HDU77_010730 [Chytriomyces hyalinus]|nr:hypothetical protein HDU77_010730 [Chytriomyces hyalinus]